MHDLTVLSEIVRTQRFFAEITIATHVIIVVSECVCFRSCYQECRVRICTVVPRIRRWTTCGLRVQE
jgi:hypothetical protein